jgi:site-specific DNA recombinase
MSASHSTNGPQAAVAYYRMSTTSQEASVPQQREWARPAVAKSGYELAAEFVDEGIPGSEVERRLDLQALIEFFEKRHRQKRPVRGLFVWDMDRLSRASSLRTAAILDQLTQAGLTHIHTADEVYDLEEDLDLVLLNLKQDLTKAAYAKAIGKNVLRSRQNRARQGLWPGGPLPLGYLLGEGGRLAVDPDWSDLIRWIYRRYADTADSLADVCRRLNNDAASKKPPSGEWSPHYVRRILTRDVYLGTLVYGERSCGKYFRNEGGQVVRVKGNAGRKTHHKADAGSAIVTEGAHEAIVDRVTFDAVGRKLTANRWKRTTPIPGGGAWVLSGIAFCGCCGRRLIGTTQRHKRGEATYVYRRLFCPGQRDRGTPCTAGQATQDVVLTELAALVKAEFGKPARVQRIGKQIEKLLAAREGEDDKRRQSLAAKLKALDLDLATAARRLLVLSEEEFPELQAAYAAMKREREQLAAELNRTEEGQQVTREEASRMREALTDMGRLEEVIADKPPELVRDLLGRIVEKVTLHFEEPRSPDAIGRRKRPLSHIDVTFRPEVAHLFTAGSSAQQVVRLTLTRKVRAAG